MEKNNILKEIFKYQQGGMVPPRMGLDLGGFQATSQPVFDGVQVQPSSVNIQPFLQGVQTIQAQDRLNLAANQALQNKESDIRNFNATIAKSMLNTSANSTSNLTKLDLTSGWQAALHAKIVAAQAAFKNGLATIIGSGNQAINPAEIMALKKPLDDLLNSEDYKRAIQVNGFRDDLLKSVAKQREKTDVVINGDAMKKKLMDIQAYAQDPSNPDIDISEIFDTSDLFYNSKDVVDNLNKMIDKYETASKEERAMIDPDNPGMAVTLLSINPLDTEEYSKAMVVEAWNSPGTKAWAESLGYTSSESFRKGMLKPHLDLRRNGLGSKRDVTTGITPVVKNLVLDAEGNIVSSLDPRVQQAELEQKTRIRQMETDEAIREREGAEAAKQRQGSVVAGSGVAVDPSIFKEYPGAAALYNTSGILDIAITPDEAIELAGELQEGAGFTAGNLDQIFRVAYAFDTAKPELTNKDVIDNTRAYLEGTLKITNPFGDEDWALQTIENIYERTMERRQAREEQKLLVQSGGQQVNENLINGDNSGLINIGPGNLGKYTNNPLNIKTSDDKLPHLAEFDYEGDGLYHMVFPTFKDGYDAGKRQLQRYFTLQNRTFRNRLAESGKTLETSTMSDLYGTWATGANPKNVATIEKALGVEPGTSLADIAETKTIDEIAIAMIAVENPEMYRQIKRANQSGNRFINLSGVYGDTNTPDEGTTPVEGRAEPVSTTGTATGTATVPPTAEPATGNTTASNIMSEQMNAEQGSPPPQGQSEAAERTSVVNDLNKQITDLKINLLNTPETDEYGRSLKSTRDSIQLQIDSLSKTLESGEAATEKQEKRAQEKDRLAQEFLSKLPTQKETKVDYVNMMGLGPLYVTKSNTTPPKFLVKKGNDIIAEGISEQELSQLLKRFPTKKK